MTETHTHRSGFTLIEIIMSIMILGIMMLISFFCFDAVVQSWQAGTEMSDTLAQADYVMDQTVAALRSAYYPDVGRQADAYGFQLHDDGEGTEAKDSISWVKIGRSLVGEDCGFSESPHRVELRISDGSLNGESGLAVKAWRADLHLDDFDPEEDVKELILSPRVIAMNCRVLDKTQPIKNEEFNWQDEWKFSNSIPKTVELTLYMKPVEEDKEPLEIKRIIDIPLWDISQNPRSGSSSGKTSQSGQSGGRDRQNRTQNNRQMPMRPNGF